MRPAAVRTLNKDISMSLRDREAGIESESWATLDSSIKSHHHQKKKETSGGREGKGKERKGKERKGKERKKKATKD